MKPTWLIVLVVVAVVGCNRREGNPDDPHPVAGGGPKTPDDPRPISGGGPITDPWAGKSLAEARKGFVTKLTRRESAQMPLDNPPPHLFHIVHFESAVGKLPAYLTPEPKEKDGKKRPAIIWITGGDCNSIDKGCWQEGPPNNDQSASAFRKAGIIMMFPSLRGGNMHPGPRESFLGEIDDVVAAAEFLAKQPHVDPDRIYLGGHSTGGTVVLLTSEYSNRFRAVFSFGPADNPLGYGPESIPFDLDNYREDELRAPVKWLASIKSPTFVIEGANKGNIDSLRKMAGTNKNTQVHFIEVEAATHFSVLAPVNRLIAQKILSDTGPQCNIELSEPEVNKLFGR